MKKSKTFLVCAMLSGSVLFSSCIGSFGLWNSLKDWNQGVSNKFVNELIFLAFHIVPVYEIAYLADALVLNSIEFWSGSNPTASIGEVKTVQGENGEYLVKTNENGYTITKKGEDKSVDLVYNKENNTWNAVADGQSFELVKMNEDGTAVLSLQNGTSMTVTPDAQGIATARIVTGHTRPLFCRTRRYRPLSSHSHRSGIGTRRRYSVGHDGTNTRLSGTFSAGCGCH